MKTKVLFLPNWTEGNAYQSLLANSLRDCGWDIILPEGTRRVFPIARAFRQYSPHLVHLHWPEAYLGKKARNPLFWLRSIAELRFISQYSPIVYTAHNLLPHNLKHNRLALWAFATLVNQSTSIIAHSHASVPELNEALALPSSKVQIVPHGDLYCTLPPISHSDSEARKILGITDSPFVLVFGAIEPYKGIEEIIAYWQSQSPQVDLYVVGRALDEDYGNRIANLASNANRVHVRRAWLSDFELANWLKVAGAVLFNYRHILTSGAAVLARSTGTPILIPSRLKTVDLSEPDPSVIRFSDFESDFAKALERALKTTRNPESTALFRKRCSWQNVARLTDAVYRQALETFNELDVNRHSSASNLVAQQQTENSDEALSHV